MTSAAAKTKVKSSGASGAAAGAGDAMYALAERLWPFNRSLTGEGVRKTLAVLKEILPELEIREVPSGTQVFDWTVPDEWNVREAWIEGPDGKRVVDFADQNLHLVGYSIPVDERLSLDELQKHLYSIPGQPDAIPYVTSYYARRWGFCMRHRDREKLTPGSYHVRVDATLAPGNLTYAELVLPGESSDEVLLSTYVCHPSMANNELSGICVTAQLAQMLSGMAKRRYTYRILFIPETIGSITYLSKHLEHLRAHVIAGYVVTCIGDERTYSYLPTRAGDTLSDRAAKHVLRHIDPAYKSYSYLDRGSDERQYNAPGVDLPIAQIMRSKYAEYPEYHTSLDDLSFISPAGLEGGYNAVAAAVAVIENNHRPMVTTICEPQLGKRGLYPPVTEPGYYDSLKTMCDLIAYSDGKKTLLEIAEVLGVPMSDVIPIYERLVEKGVLRDEGAGKGPSAGS